MDPSGKAIAAAIPSRSGVSGVIFSAGGIEAMAQQHMVITQLPKLEPSVLGLFIEEKIVVTAEVELASRDLL
jgi:hypothetical protein